MRILRILLLAGGLLGLPILVYEVGTGSIAATLARITWWQFAALCILYGANIAIDALGWQYTLGEDRASFRTLFAARCASEASNAFAAVSAVGGEAIKAWLVRVELRYRESVPSLIIAKTAEVLAQAVLFAFGI